MQDPLSVRVFGHRGGRKLFPENTLAAFAGAMKAGAHGIELDVQRCASGELVVIHDLDLGRTAGGTGRVVDTNLSDLKLLDAGSWFNESFKDEKIPTLLEVFSLIDGNLIINIELKLSPDDDPSIVDDLAKAVSHYKYPDRLLVSSFDHRLLMKVSDTTDLSLALLAECIFYDLEGYASTLGVSWWHPKFISLNKSAVEAAHQAGLLVNTWTVNGKENWRAAINMGVDVITTDEPEELILFLDQIALANESIC